jgi:SAM-dependent methyltransferase
MTGFPYTSTIGRELLDDPAADPSQVRESLRNIARSNWVFGGIAAADFGLARVLEHHPARQATLLDIGVGAGDVPRALVERFARRGVALAPLGLDLNRTAARLATSRGVPSVQGDGLGLPLRSRSVDLVLLSQVAHHLTPDGIRLLAREASRVARLGVVIADLKRSRWAELGFGIAGRLLRFDPATVADGVTSLKRGFRGEELEALLRGAGLPAQCHERLGARVVAWWSVSP